MTAVHIYEGRLVIVNADNSFGPTYLLRQATLASVAAVVVNVERRFADGGTYQKLNSFPSIRCASA
jgi:hypothetical protein